MKVRIYNQSGLPIHKDKLLQYEKEFKGTYDRLWASHKAGEISIEEMKMSLAELDKELGLKYPMFEEIELPKSGKGWADLLLKYGCGSLTLGFDEERGKLTLILMDSAYGSL